VSVNKIYNQFEHVCLKNKIPSETALYSLLRSQDTADLAYPHYPQITLSKYSEDKIPYSVLVENYFKRQVGPIPYAQISEYFVERLG